MVLFAGKRDTGGEQRFLKAAAGRDSDSPTVEIRPLAFFGPEHLIRDRLVNNPGHGLAVSLQGDGNGKVRNPVKKVGGPIQGVDDPAVRRVGAFDFAALLKQETEPGPCFRQPDDQDFFGFLVGGGDEIRRAFLRHLKIFDLAEVADQPPGRLGGRGRPHIQ